MKTTRIHDEALVNVVAAGHVAGVAAAFSDKCFGKHLILRPGRPGSTRLLVIQARLQPSLVACREEDPVLDGVFGVARLLPDEVIDCRGVVSTGHGVILPRLMEEGTPVTVVESLAVVARLSDCFMQIRPTLLDLHLGELFACVDKMIYTTMYQSTI